MRFNTDHLMKWFVREPYKTHDQVILETFHRINKREAQDMLLEIERGFSFIFIGSVYIIRNSSRHYWLSPMARSQIALGALNLEIHILEVNINFSLNMKNYIVNQ